SGDAPGDFVGKRGIHTSAQGREVVDEAAATGAILETELGWQDADMRHRCDGVDVWIYAHDQALTTGWFHQGGQRPERRAFASTIRPEESEHLAMRDVEIDILNAAMFPVCFREVYRLNRALHARLPALLLQ